MPGSAFTFVWSLPRFVRSVVRVAALWLPKNRSMSGAATASGVPATASTACVIASCAIGCAVVNAVSVAVSIVAHGCWGGLISAPVNGSVALQSSVVGVADPTTISTLRASTKSLLELIAPGVPTAEETVTASGEAVSSASTASARVCANVAASSALTKPSTRTVPGADALSVAICVLAPPVSAALPAAKKMREVVEVPTRLIAKSVAPGAGTVVGSGVGRAGVSTTLERAEVGEPGVPPCAKTPLILAAGMPAPLGGGSVRARCAASARAQERFWLKVASPAAVA